MQFKVKSTEFKVSFTFIAVYFIFLGYGKGDIFLYSLVSSLLHECVHILLIVIFGGRISLITLNAAGGNIVREQGTELSFLKEGIISISAPAFNITLGAVILFFDKNNLFAMVNIMLGCFNILPFFSFDGGRAMGYFLSSVLSHNTIEKIKNFTSAVVVCVFAFLSVYIFFCRNQNYFLVVMSVFMLVTLILRIRDKNCNNY